MKAKQHALESIRQMLSDRNVPTPHKRRLLLQLLHEENEETMPVIESVLESFGANDPDSLAAEAKRRYDDLMHALKAGPLRTATYVGPLVEARNGVERVEVRLESGEPLFPVLPDGMELETLGCGDTVVVDAQASTILARVNHQLRTGEEAKFERVIGADRVEAVLRDHEPQVFQVSARLAEDIAAGRVTNGRKLLVCSRKGFAFEALPEEDASSHRRHLADEPPPDVRLERDLGDPHVYIGEVVEHLRIELEQPELARRYGIRRAVTRLLAGVSGSGKTYSILALWNELYAMMSEVTGVPVDALPRRVMRLKLSALLSHWLGMSDSNVERFFDDVEALAAERFVAPDGREWELPLLVICEECDGLARARGMDVDGVYDRIQTTLLQRLDTNCESLGNRPVVFLFTTNIPHAVDPAFLRRAGGRIERFGRLGRSGFRAVLEKKLRGLPLAGRDGLEGAALEKRLAAELSDWLFETRSVESRVVEATMVGSAVPERYTRGDLATAALVDRAVQDATTRTCLAEARGESTGGISYETLQDALDGQVRSVVDQLSPHNLGEYVTLPEGARVANLRRIPRSVLPSHRLARRVS